MFGRLFGVYPCLHDRVGFHVVRRHPRCCGSRLGTGRLILWMPLIPIPLDGGATGTGPGAALAGLGD